MPEITIVFKPTLQELAKKFNSMDVKGFLDKQIKILAFLVERESKIVAPVDTGRMRASIRVMGINQQLKEVVQPNVDYAIFVHEGTRYMKGRPFMFWGATTASKDFAKVFGARLETHIRSKL